MDNIIEIDNLYYSYEDEDNYSAVIDNLNLNIERGSFTVILGHNGSGKSTLAKCIVGLNKNYTGTLNIKEDHPQLVFQDPYSSLNPMKKIGWILEEPLKIHGMKDQAKRKELVDQMLTQVGLDPSYSLDKVCCISCMFLDASTD